MTLAEALDWDPTVDGGSAVLGEWATGGVGSFSSFTPKLSVQASSDGVDAACTSRLLGDGERAWVEARFNADTVVCTTPPSSLSFPSYQCSPPLSPSPPCVVCRANLQVQWFWSVSSEAFYDSMFVTVDGNKIALASDGTELRISGELNYTLGLLTLPVGPPWYTVRWNFAKDGSGSAGSNTACLDRVTTSSITEAPTELPTANPSSRNPTFTPSTSNPSTVKPTLPSAEPTPAPTIDPLCQRLNDNGVGSNNLITKTCVGIPPITIAPTSIFILEPNPDDVFIPLVHFLQFCFVILHFCPIPRTPLTMHARNCCPSLEW